jgi:hypothetical protein
MVGSAIGTIVIGGALILVPHVRRSLKNLAHVGTANERLGTASS